MSQSQALNQSTHVAMERNIGIIEKGRLALMQMRSPVEIETNPDNLYLPPMIDTHIEGTFTDGKDLWYESD
jgi:hypothetical protein